MVDVPDYSDLFDLAKESSTYSYGLGKEQWDFFKKIYEKQTGPLNDKLIEVGLGELDKNIKESDWSRAFYHEQYEPLEREMVKQAKEYNTPERQELEAGKAEKDVSTEFEQARRVAQEKLEAYGVDPSQTRQQALDLGTRVAEAAASAAAGNNARARTEQIGREMMANAVNIGRGYPGQAVNQSQAGGQFGNQAANINLAGVTSAAQTQGTAPQWQQIGNQGLGTWGNLVNAKFQNERDAEALEQQSSSGFGSLLGAAGGILTAFLEEGGAIPDDGRSVPAEASPSDGAIPDDVPAEIEGGQPARLNAGEFVIPKDVVSWLGEKGMQQFILKARKEMSNPQMAPAQPSTTPPPGAMPAYDGAGAIPS